MTTATRMLIAVLSGLLLFALTAEARADQKQECSAAYDATQTLRDEDNLLDARKQALTCGNEQCPAFIRSDCAQWLVEIEALVPTVLFTIEEMSGTSAQAARVLLDGNALSEWTTGNAVSMNSGRHRVRFEIVGSEAIEKDFVAQNGEKNRKIVAFFRRKPAEPAPPPGSIIPETKTSPPAQQVVLPPVVVPAASSVAEVIKPQTTSTTTIPAWAWISGGTGVALLGTSAALGAASGNDERRAAIALAATGVIGILAGVLGSIPQQLSTQNAQKTISFTPFVSSAGSGLAAHGRF